MFASRMRFQSGRSIFPMNQQLISFFNIFGLDGSSKPIVKLFRNSSYIITSCHKTAHIVITHAGAYYQNIFRTKRFQGFSYGYVNGGIQTLHKRKLYRRNIGLRKSHHHWDKSSVIVAAACFVSRFKSRCPQQLIDICCQIGISGGIPSNMISELGKTIVIVIHTGIFPEMNGWQRFFPMSRNN
ncbi:MAG: hypothetical protein BWZ06_01882 [Bacteroidetes bacterium ADurb.BinA261]|nr:MAG: hypothetical protein BWZ06_01882 [Bacteroidetes bacterium ADurb.BinA261]